MMAGFLCAVDVGTGSARAGIFDGTGRLHGRGESPIAMNRPAPGHAEHDSGDIWRAVCAAVRQAVSAADVAPGDIAGIGFDATCSLVLRDSGFRPVTASTTGEDRWDTIVWLDHRAHAEADACTATGHRVLSHLGGVMSPEMQMPKLMWLKRNLPDSWARMGHAFDLADFLTWKASGSTARSQCTLACKWTYLAHEDQPWQQDFLARIGLPDVLARAGLPDLASPVAADLGPLTVTAAAELGLPTSCRVGAGLIDAYAGALGVLGRFAGEPAELERHVALIAGTSSCVMTLASAARPFAGGWGPYFGVALPDLWLVEGGQSVTGALLDHVVRIHAAGGQPDAAMHRRIAERIGELRKTEGEAFARRLHVVPDFHGNRSPLADPHALGVVSGLDMSEGFDGLCRLYWRTCVGIALGVRHILDTMNAAGAEIDTLHVTGGHTRNPLLMELYAEAVGCRLVEPLADDAVLLGGAMVAAAAAGVHADLPQACRAMAQPQRERSGSGLDPFARDYRVFQAMHRHRAEIDGIG